MINKYGHDGALTTDVMKASILPERDGGLPGSLLPNNLRQCLRVRVAMLTRNGAPQTASADHCYARDDLNCPPVWVAEALRQNRQPTCDIYLHKTQWAELKNCAVISRLPDPNGSMISAHAVVLTDWPPGQPLRFKNSWGPETGDQGSFSVSSPHILNPADRYLKIIDLYWDFTAAAPDDRRTFEENIRNYHSRELAIKSRLQPTPMVDRSDISFEQQQPIGSGSQGEVFHGSFRGVPVAVKVRQRREIERLPDELKFSILHKNIVRIYGYSQEIVNRPIRQMWYFIAMELLSGGNLRTQFGEARERARPSPNNPIAGGRFGWRKVFSIAENVLDALCVMEEHGMLHCDICDTNIVLTQDGIAKLIDFGSQKFIGTMPGSVVAAHDRWMAPELGLHPPQISTKSDVFSFGKLLQYLLCDGILDGNLATLGPADFPVTFRDLISTCCIEHCSGRPTAFELRVKLKTMKLDYFDASRKVSSQFSVY